jgi:hypothetical protein
MSHKRNNQRRLQRAHERIAEIHKQIESLDYACSGTLLTRMKLCGKASCRCAQDPHQRHGPYYEWNRLLKGRLVHRVVLPGEVGFLRRAIANYRKVQRLLRRWEGETVRVLEARKPDKD